MKRVLLTFLMLICIGAPGRVMSAPANGATIDGVWATLSTAKPDTVNVYMTVWMPHGSTDQLLGVLTPVASSVEMVAPESAGSGKTTGRFQKIDEITIDGQEPLVFQPHGPHLILTGLRQHLKQGQSFLLLLDFAHSGMQAVTATMASANPARGMPQLPKGLKLD